MKVEKVLANPVAPTVIWLAGSACTGCTMSLLNSVFYTTVDDLLINRINLAYLDTAMATAGAYTSNDGGQYPGANALAVAQKIYNGTDPFVLVVEGAIPTATPPGSTTAGDYCRIGNLTATGAETVLENVSLFANHTSCLAVLAVGTCSSFGGIPGAKGNVVGAKGVAFSGTTRGGAIVSDKGHISSIMLDNNGLSHGDLYATDVAVTFTGGGGTGAAATARTDIGQVTGITGGTGGTGLNNVVVTITGDGTGATGYAQVTGGVITALKIQSGGSGYTTATVTVTASTGTLPAAGTATIGTGFIKNIAISNGGTGYTSAPTVGIPGGTPLAAATAKISSGDVKSRSGLAAKVINISGCPPHPDWIVGTIAHLLDTNLSEFPAVNSNYQPVDHGYKEYQCNAGPCTWRYNNATSKDGYNDRYPITGDSQKLGREKWISNAVGCIGILGCKGRKTKADCSRRRWNADGAEQYGVNWCVGSRAGCHGCTEPAFPDKVGKFFTFA